MLSFRNVLSNLGLSMYCAQYHSPSCSFRTRKYFPFAVGRFPPSWTQGAVVFTRLWTYAQFWNSQDKVGGGREGHVSICLVLLRRGVLNEVAKALHLWQEVHLLFDTSTLAPGDDVPSMLEAPALSDPWAD